MLVKMGLRGFEPRSPGPKPGILPGCTTTPQIKGGQSNL